ncbi:hypothetical protein HZB03_04100 [Candidatus Woesearchaeota archaeon]|nr:hypothetical protein [Candidatus Woesearchaeota archaeon]
MAKSGSKKSKKTRQTERQTERTSITQEQAAQKLRAQKEASVLEEKKTPKGSAQDGTDFLNKQFASLPAHHGEERAGLRQWQRTLPASASSSISTQFPPRFSQIQQSRNKIKEAFGAIKHDMLLAKEVQHQHAARISELKQLLKDSQTDYVTIDKFNVFKIKFSELGDLINKLQDKLQDQVLRLEQADDDRAKAAASHDQMNAVTGKLDKLSFDLKELAQTAATKEQLLENLGEYRASIDDLRDQFHELVQKKDVLTPRQEQKIDAALAEHSNVVQSRLKEFKKGLDVYVTASQTEQLLTDINAEFDGVKQNISQLIKKQKEFGSFPELVDVVDAVQKQVAALEKSLKNFATQKQVQNVLDDVNDEFDNVQNEFNLIHHEIRKGLSVFVTKKQLQQTRGEWKENLEDLRKMIGKNVSDVAAVRKELQQELKNYVPGDRLEIEVDDVHKEVHEIADAVKKLYDRRKSGPDIADIDKRLSYHVMMTKEKHVERDEYNLLVDDVNRIKKLISDAKTKKKAAAVAQASDLKASKRLAKPKVALPRVDQQGKRLLQFLGTFLIVAAFGLLILDIVFFYLNVLTRAGTALSVASVACFVVGMGVRIYLTLTGKN